MNGRGPGPGRGLADAIAAVLRRDGDGEPLNEIAPHLHGGRTRPVRLDPVTVVARPERTLRDVRAEGSAPGLLMGGLPGSERAEPVLPPRPEVRVPRRVWDPSVGLAEALATARPVANDATATPESRADVADAERLATALSSSAAARELYQRNRMRAADPVVDIVEGERDRLRARPGLARALDYAGAAGAQTLTLGYRDELMGALSPTRTAGEYVNADRLRTSVATPGDRFASLAGAIAGAALPIAGQNALLFRAGRFAPEGSAARGALQSFGRTGARTRVGDVGRGAVEGIPYDLAYDYEEGDDRALNLGIGVAGGGLAGGILRPGGNRGSRGAVEPQPRRGADSESLIGPRGPIDRQHAGAAHPDLVGDIARIGTGAAVGGAIGSTLSEHDPAVGAIKGALAGAGLGFAARDIPQIVRERAADRYTGFGERPRVGLVRETPGGRLQVLGVESYPLGPKNTLARVRITSREPGEPPIEGVMEWDTVERFAETHRLQNEPLGVVTDTSGRFLGSRVADARGKPKTVYYSPNGALLDYRRGILGKWAPDDIKNFAPDRPYGPGHYFAEVPAAVAEDAKPARLIIRNPFRQDLRTPAREAIPIYRRAGLEEEAAKLEERIAVRDLLGSVEAVEVPQDHVYSFVRRAVGREEANRILQELGYDGITYIGEGAGKVGPYRVWVAFDESQMRGASDPPAGTNGAAIPSLVGDLARTGAGAAIGGAVDREDPLRGAAIGAGLGAAAPGIARSARSSAGVPVRSLAFRLHNAARK